MQKIIHHHNFSERVRVEYRDEMGTRAHTFNITIAELMRADQMVQSLNNYFIFIPLPCEKPTYTT